MCVYVLLLHGAAILQKDVGIKELEPCCLTETSELIMDEAIVDTVELVDIVDYLPTFGSNEFLGERVSADGDAKANHAFRREHGWRQAAVKGGKTVCTSPLQSK